MISTRTPEGSLNRCAVCGREVLIEPSTVPVRDAPCPHCGCLLWFPEPGTIHVQLANADSSAIFAQFDESVGQSDARHWLIDFEGGRFFSSETIGKLITLHRNIVARGGRMTICNIPPDIAEAMRITKLDSLF